MIRRPPRSTRTDTLFPYTTLFRSAGDLVIERLRNRQGDFRARVGDVEQVDLLVIFTRRDFLSAQHPAKLAWRQEIIEDDDMIILEAFRSEERRVVNECVSTCKFRGSPVH